MHHNKLVSNEQAFRALASGNKEAKFIIIANFENYIKGRAGQFIATTSDQGIDFNEFLLVGKAALGIAIYTYRGGAESCASYATVVIQNAMANYMKQHRSPTSCLTRYGLSLDENLFDDTNSLLMCDLITETHNEDDLGFYEPRSIGYFEDILPVPLTEEDLLIVEERLLGYNYREIQKRHNFPKRKLDTLIARIKEKFKCKD